MAMKLSRKFLNPVLVLAGGLTLVSGLYLFFHLKSRPIVLIHEWSSIIFVVACAAHLALNWNSLFKSLGSRAVAWTLLAVVLLSGLGMAFTDIKTDHRHRQRIVDDRRPAAEVQAPASGLPGVPPGI